MKVLALSLFSVLVVGGVGGKLAYDAYQQREQERKWEKVLSASNCGLCAERQKDMKRLMEYNAERSLSHRPTE